MLNISQIVSAKRIDSPFKHAVIENLLSVDQSQLLVSSLPREGNYRSSRATGSDKVYNVVNNILLELGKNEYNKKSQLPDAWINIIEQFQSKEYRSALSYLLDEDVTICPMEITLKRYKYKDYISAHTDKDCVRATHMIFLNDEWYDEWGGLLHLMYDDSNSFQKFLPTRSKSVAFVRAENSWHKVCPVLEENRERIAIQVAFWNKVDRYVAPGRNIQIETVDD